MGLNFWRNWNKIGQNTSWTNLHQQRTLNWRGQKTQQLRRLPVTRDLRKVEKLIAVVMPASMEEVWWFTRPLKILKMVPLKSKREIRTYFVLSSSDSVDVGNLLNKKRVMNLCDWSFKVLKSIILDVPSRVISAEVESLKRKEVQVRSTHHLAMTFV